MRKKGFTLIELMVVVLIVAILAMVAIPMMRGRIDAAKWSEGKAGAGTIVTAIRALCAEKGDDITVAGAALVDDLGFAVGDLNGTYFTDASYTAIGYGYAADTGLLSFTVTVVAGNGTSEAPSTPGQYVFAQAAGGLPTWTPSSGAIP